MTRPAVIPWSADDTAAALRDRYRAEPEGVVRTRLHALWLLRQPEAGWTPTTVAAALGVHRCTVQQWLRWYRAGGLEAVRWRGLLRILHVFKRVVLNQPSHDVVPIPWECTMPATAANGAGFI